MTTTANTLRQLVSPDGMRGVNVHPLDAPNPLYAGWTDCTELTNEEFHALVEGRQKAAKAAA